MSPRSEAARRPAWRAWSRAGAGPRGRARARARAGRAGAAGEAGGGLRAGPGGLWVEPRRVGPGYGGTSTRGLQWPTDASAAAVCPLGHGSTDDFHAQDRVPVRLGDGRARLRPAIAVRPQLLRCLAALWEVRRMLRRTAAGPVAGAVRASASDAGGCWRRTRHDPSAGSGVLPRASPRSRGSGRPLHPPKSPAAIDPGQEPHQDLCPPAIGPGSGAS